MNIDHFEQLWVLCENEFKSDTDTDLNEILNKIQVTIGLYKNLSSKPVTEDLPRIKAHLIGELLLHLSHLSLKEDIDVFAAMKTALKFKLV